MSLEQAFRIEASAGKTVINVKGYIYEWTRNNSIDIEARVDEAIAAGHTELEMHINSPGGDPVEGNQLGIVIDKFPGKKVLVMEAIAASTATIFLDKFDERECYPTSAIMVHEPKGFFSGTHDQIEASNKMLKLIKEGMIAGYARITGKSESEIADMIKTDYWMSAKEAKKLGFVTKIRTGSAESIDEDSITAATSRGLVIPSNIIAAATAIKEPTSKSQNTMSKLKLIAAALGMTGADIENEDKIVLEANAAITSAKESKAKLDAANAEIERLKNAAKTEKVTAAKTAIAEAKAANKITAEQETLFTAQCESNPELVMSMLKTMQPHVTAASMIKDAEGKTENTLEAKMEKRADWSWSKWSKEDADGLAKIKAEKPEAYKALFKAEFGTDPRN